MSDRLLLWAGAGLLTAGLSTSALVAIGTAAADTGDDAGEGRRSSVQSAVSRPAEAEARGQDDTGRAASIGTSGPQTLESKLSDEAPEPDAARQTDQATGPKDDRRPDRGSYARSEDDDERNPSRPAVRRDQDADEARDAAETIGQDRVADAGVLEPAAAQTARRPEIVLMPKPEVGAPRPLAGVADRAVSPIDSPPPAPLAAAAAWTAAAAATRRESDVPPAPSLMTLAAEPATSQAQNALIYTAQPSLQDRIALVVHKVFRAVKNITGFDVHAALGRAMASSDPPFFLKWGLQATKKTYTLQDGTVWRAWEFEPPKPSGKTVIAFHGGGWIFQPSVLNWIDYTNMARETGARVVVPLYPLATTEAGRATEVIPDAADFISQQIATHGADQVSLYADSAGGSIALAGVRALLLADKPVPASMVIISAVMDSSMQNPDIREIDDPIFDVDDLDSWKSHWYDGIADLRDPLVSPLFFEPEVLQALPPTTIYVGDQEVLYPDTLLLHQRAVGGNAAVSVVVGRGLIHAWAMSGLPLLSTQTPTVRPAIYRQLGISGVGSA